MKSYIPIGTRGSQLAMVQAERVKTCIEKDFPMVAAKRIKIKTGGDMVRRGGIKPLESKRMFTREIEDALLKKEVDLAVHSAKDMAVLLPKGLKISAVLEREDPRDCLISQEKKKLSELSEKARIGTSSLRRKKQLLRHHPELAIEEVRGNVETRIRKVQEGQYDGVVLAYAGVKRLGLENYVAEIFSEEKILPAPGQGIIAVESRVGDRDTDEILAPMNHEETMKQLTCERAFLKRLEGGCQLPCGIKTTISEGQIMAQGALFSVEGSECAEGRTEGASDNPGQIGEKLANMILEKGGREILEKIRHEGRSKK